MLGVWRPIRPHVSPLPVPLPALPIILWDRHAAHLFTFGDIEGKLDVLRVECTKCERKGRYSVAKLIEEHGRRDNMSAWVRDLKGDCPRRDAHSLHER